MQKLLKILIISHTASIGGAEKALLELVDGLIKRKVICQIVMPRGGQMEFELRRKSIKYYIIPFTWWIRKKNNDNKKINQSAILKIREIIKIFNPNIIFTNTIVIPWGAIAAMQEGKSHAWMIHEYGNKDHGFKFRFSYKNILKIIDMFSNIIFVNSEAIKKNIQHIINKNKIIKTYYFIENKNTNCIKKWFRRKKSFKIVLIGRVVKSKGQLDALMAIKYLIKKNLNLELLFIGKGKPGKNSYFEKLKNRIRNNNLESNIKLLGHINNPFPIINAADILLMCSRNEAFGRVTVEAMLLKKPIIGTNKGGTKELIKNNYNGLFYKAGDYKDLAKKIKYFYYHKDKLQKFGKNGLLFAKNNFSDDGYTGKIYRNLKRIMKQQNNFLKYSKHKENKNILRLIEKI